jgi:hypothetical protein
MNMQPQRYTGTAIRTLACVVLLNTWAVAAEPDPTPAAQAHFKAGNEFLKAKSWPEAYREFKAAYSITPKWTALGNLGIAADHLERDGEAIDSMESYLQRGGDEIDSQEGSQVRRDLERLRSGIATVTLESASPGTIWVADTRVAPDGPIVNEYGPFEGRVVLRVRAGKHEFALKHAENTTPSWSANLLPGDTAAHTFALETDPPPVGEFNGTAAGNEKDMTDRSHTTSYLLWGTGSAAAVAATVFLLQSNRVQSDADEDFVRRCPLGASGMNGCENSTEGDRSAATWRTAALVTGVGALGALIGGTVLYISESSRSDGEASEAAVRPCVSPTGMGVAGVF